MPSFGPLPSSNSILPGAKKPPWSAEFNFVPSFSEEVDTITFVISLVDCDLYVALSPKSSINLEVGVGT